MTQKVVPDKSSSSGMPLAVRLIPALRRSPVGALVGLMLVGLLTLIIGVDGKKLLLEVPIALLCVPGCMFLERIIDWRFSGKVDARMRHSAASEDARLAMQKLDDYKERKIINQPDAHKLAALIAKRDVAGGPKEGRARSHHRRRTDSIGLSQQPNGSAQTERSDSEKPAA